LTCEWRRHLIARHETDCDSRYFNRHDLFAVCCRPGGREHQNANLNYPNYTFFRYKDAQPDDVFLSEFSGPVYDSGGGKVQLNVRYEYMIAVKMDKTNVNIITPTPSSSASPR
jgi:hypothetical protein